MGQANRQGLGAAELVLGQLPITRRRRLAFIVLTTLGATLLVAAFPFKFSGSNLSVLWLLEAEAFFLVGVFAPEVIAGFARVLRPVTLMTPRDEALARAASGAFRERVGG